MAKARVGLYEVKGSELSRTHKFCPKCGSGVFLAEHGNRRSCGRCGYAESKAPAATKATPPTPTTGKPKAPKAPAPAPAKA